MKKIIFSVLLICIMAQVSYAVDIPKSEIVYKQNRWKINEQGQGLIMIDKGTVTIVSGNITISPRNWRVEGTPTQTLTPLQTITMQLPVQYSDYWLYSLLVTGSGADAKIEIDLPSPNFKQVKRINAIITSAEYNYGEGILIANGDVVTIKISSTTSEASQEIDVSWQKTQ